MKVIWKDSLDEQTFHIGVYSKNSGKVTLWVSLFTDGVYDMFGKEFSVWATALPEGYYHEISLSASPIEKE